MRIFKISRATPVVVNRDVDRAAKTEAESSMKALKFLMFVVLSMYMMLGTSLIVQSISIISHFSSLSLFNDFGQTVISLAVVVGVMLVFVTVYGYFATVRHNTVLVNVFASILSMLFILELVLVILAFTSFEDQTASSIHVPVNMYWVPQYQREIDSLQRKYACCGSKSFLDYNDMNFEPGQPIVTATLSVGGELITLKLPESCCISANNGYCYQVPSIGCQYALYDALVDHFKIIAYSGITSMVVTFLGVIFALLMARNIRKLKSVQGLLAWRVQERIIVARQAAERQQPQNQPNQERQQQQNQPNQERQQQQNQPYQERQQQQNQPQQETQKNQDQQNHVYIDPQSTSPA